MLPLPCECCSTCSIASDDFSVDNLATDWDVRSGSWTVTGGEVQTASASALLIANDAYTTETAAYASAAVQCISTSDAARVVLLYSDDSNYWFAEVQPGASNGTLKLFQRSGGVNTQRGSTVTMTGLTAGTSVTVWICYAGGSVAANAQLSSQLAKATHYAATLTVAGTKGGIGTGAMGSRVDFDSFLLSRNGYEIEDCPTCGLDCSNCIEGSMPALDVAITFTGMVGLVSNYINCNFNCDALNGITFIIPPSNYSNCGAQDYFTVEGCIRSDGSGLPATDNILVNYGIIFITPNYIIQANILPSTSTYTFRYNNGTTKPTCSTLDVVATWHSGTDAFRCDPSGGSAHIVV